MDDSAWQTNSDAAPVAPSNDVPLPAAHAEEQQWNGGNGGTRERERERSPLPPRENNDRERRRSRSRSPGPPPHRESRNGGGRDGRGDERGHNQGSNLHVSGLSHKVDTRELEATFAKFGRVKKASVMYDPHSRESRGFGFVEMETAEEAEAAIANLNATDLNGKVMNVEKARRGRARTPTPGRYHGPPKRNDFERPYDPRPYDSRYSRDFDGGRDDRRGGGGGGRYDREGGGGGGGYRGGDRGGYRDREERPRYDDRRYDDRAPREDRGPPREDRGGPPREDRGPPRESRGYEERPRY